LYGTRFWTVTYNGSANGNDTAIAISYLPNGLVAVTGNSLEINGSNKNAIVTMLIDSGTVLWTQKYYGDDDNGAFAKAIAIDQEGNIFVCGFEKSASGSDAVILKYDQSGNLKWNEVFNGTGNLSDRFNSIVVDDSANIYVTGQSFNSSTNSDYVTAKYAQTGVFSSIPSGNSDSGELTVFPNPVASYEVMVTGAFKEGDRISLFDEAGRKIFSSAITAPANWYHIPLANFSEGFYVVAVESNASVTKVKLVVQ